MGKKYDHLQETLASLKVTEVARDHFFEKVMKQHREIDELNKTVTMLRREINRWYDKYPINDEEES